MKARLVILSGNTAGTIVQIAPPMVIGRGREADVKLLHSQISRQHCEITDNNGTLFVRDLGSMNGTLIDGVKIAEPTVLPSGSMLSVGGVAFRVEYDAGTGTMSDATDGTTVSKLEDLRAGNHDEPQTESARPAAPMTPAAAKPVDDVIQFDDLDAAAMLPDRIQVSPPSDPVGP